MAVVELIIEWFRANPDVFGFFVASLIFLTTITLVALRAINFWVTLLFLLFALFSGLTVGNQHLFKERLKRTQQEVVVVEENQ